MQASIKFENLFKRRRSFKGLEKFTVKVIVTQRAVNQYNAKISGL